LTKSYEVSRTLPAGLNRLWPYVVAGVALGVALVAALAVARQYALADEQRQGQLAMLETHGNMTRLMSDAARTPRELKVLALAELSPPVELRDDRVVARELREARIRVARLADDKTRGRPVPKADAEAVWRLLSAAAARAGRVAEQTRRDANLNAGYSAAAGAFLVAVLLWLLLAGRRKAAVEAAETRALRWFRGLVQNSSDAILVTRPTGEIRYATPSIERIVGHPAGELAGRSLVDLAPEADREALAAALADVGATPRSDEWRVRHRDGTTVPVEAVLARWDDDNRSGDAVVVNLRDVRERKALEDQLRHRAFHDELTGLANRALFEDRLTHALARARRHAAWVAVLFLDLDDFKPVNDALGHPAGDALLQEVARRIAECLRASDTGARVGGDEFAVLLEDAASPAEADEVAERLLESIRQPVVLSGQELFPSASLGMALEEAGGATATELLRDADVAMYTAKRTGKGQISRFEAAMRTNAVERLHLRADLERAVERGELRLLYQPIVQLDTGAVIEVEALARWHHPLRGLLNPEQFIPIAEETGLIVPIGRYLLHRACAEAATWRAAGGGPSDVSVSVNLSARQLQHAQLVDDVRDALREGGLPASRLVLEVTENVLIDDATRALEQLEELRGLGVRIALDDFGTGYSSLSYVRRFPLDELKVDRSFIDRLGQADSDSALVHTIATLADNLGVRLVAEGIERKEQLTALQDLQCELGQGFLFARPLESEALVALLQQGAAAEPPVGAA
jgi:diguanylate cyclase (GGDEF)-like protein/PAS domain S-box-containing protein